MEADPFTPDFDLQPLDFAPDPFANNPLDGHGQLLTCQTDDWQFTTVQLTVVVNRR